ncbi:MAG: hypothetical protein EA367_14095 [Leptolyngbya sp. DLM2.Bin15]|nr:MAG: hypothetical protein EA367_14095 [Leptolyngbya sp. DLM2.Bin15]
MGLTEAQHRAIAEVLRKISLDLSEVMNQIDQAYGRDSTAFRAGFSVDIAVGDLKDELSRRLAREWSRSEGATGVETIVKARGLYERR